MLGGFPRWCPSSAAPEARAAIGASVQDEHSTGHVEIMPAPSASPFDGSRERRHFGGARCDLRKGVLGGHSPRRHPARRAAWLSSRTCRSTPRSALCSRGSPITPVDAMKTCEARHPAALAACRQLSRLDTLLSRERIGVAGNSPHEDPSPLPAEIFCGTNRLARTGIRNGGGNARHRGSG